MIKLFYSYSHNDEKFRAELEKHLSMLMRQGVISGWNDRGIAAGADWVGEIDRHLESADIVLLLVSADFLASNYCYDVEMKRAMEMNAKGEAKVIPIILRQCDWRDAPFGRLQALPSGAKPVTLWPDQDAAFADVVEGIRAVCRNLGPPAGKNVSEEEAGPSPRRAPAEGTGGEAPAAGARTLESRYSNLFQTSSLTLPYVVLVGAWESDANEYGMGEVVSLTDPVSTYRLPEEFRNNPTPGFFFSDLRCRLTHYDCAIVRDGLSRLTFTFSKIEYRDYLLSGEHLDSPLPDDPGRTFRDKYAPRLDLHDLGHSALTNICGVGIFILTRDGKVIVSKHSRSVKVYGDTWTYSASGTMDWGEDVHPFHEVARECFEEIGHRINLDNTYLFGFGIDAKKLYFQFSFFERTGLSSEEILAKARMARDYHAEMEELQALPLELDAVVAAIKSRAWEPAAAAGLLTLCAKRFGSARVERAIDPKFLRKRVRDEMEAEWEHRATRPNERAVMSARYPASRSREESEKYLSAVFEFIGSDLDGKDVLEIGAGIGRMSEVLVRKARQLTCVDLSSKMLERNRERLGALAEKVHYIRMFGQDYRPDRSYDAALSSLVLIHNVDENDFRRVVEVMKQAAGTIFLFEHIDVGYQVSRQTRLRSEEELLAAFRGYTVERRREYQLFTDNLVFLKLVR
ncbi:MAG TPA: TIR domain-containing protein [Pyrinomonadaceae bacterium]